MVNFIQPLKWLVKQLLHSEPRFPMRGGILISIGLNVILVFWIFRLILAEALPAGRTLRLSLRAGCVRPQAARPSTALRVSRDSRGGGPYVFW
jgi:hypothetical protein